MHPVSKVHFGDAEGQIAVKFHNGTSAVTGYIVKQIGSTRYVVSDGSITKTCSLASTTDVATSLVEGKMTIEIVPHGGGAAQHVKNLSAFIAFTTEGNRLSWKLENTSKAGEGKLAVVEAPAPAQAPAPAPVPGEGE